MGGDTMGKIFDAIDRQIIRPRVYESESEGFSATQDDVQSFYIQGDPKYYERTGALGESPRSAGVISKGNGNYHYKIYLEDPEYNTGTYDGHKVLEEAQYHGSGILGRAGTWFESEQDIIDAIKHAFQ